MVLCKEDWAHLRFLFCVPIVQVMADVYASAVGLMVLQMKEIPPRPPEFDGRVCLFSLKEGVDEEKIESVLQLFGTVVECDMNRDPVVVTFASHEEALSAVQAGAPDLCDGIDTQYNERSYDGRAGEVGRRDDDGRGWCAPPLLFHIAPLPSTFQVGGAMDAPPPPVRPDPSLRPTTDKSED